MTKTANISFIRLNNGVELPALGLGVFQSPPEQTTAAVEAAIAAGYPLIDTAASYFNEREGRPRDPEQRHGPLAAVRPDQTLDQRLRL
jgi:aryl-alcohol dehydrogenase-like predicted oxidoreductase